MFSPKITIAILTYNRSQLLATALRSAVDQATPAEEILIIDDGSTDDTENVVQQFKTYNNQIRYIKQANAGHSAARNKAVQSCKTSHLMWLDDDDALTPSATTVHYSYLHKNPGADIIYGKLMLCDENLCPIEFMPSHILQKDNTLHLFFKHNPVPNPATLISLSCFQKVGPYNERFRHAEDYDFFARAASKRCTFLHVPELLAYYRSHSKNLATANKLQKIEHERAWVLADFFGRENIENIFPQQPWQENIELAFFNSTMEAAIHFARFGDFSSATELLSFGKCPSFAEYQTIMREMIAIIEQSGPDGIRKFASNPMLLTGPCERLLDVLLERTLEPEKMDTFRAELLNSILNSSSLPTLYPHLPWQNMKDISWTTACIQHAARLSRLGDFSSSKQIIGRIQNSEHRAIGDFISKLIDQYEAEGLNGIQHLTDNPIMQSPLGQQIYSVLEERSARYQTINQR